MTDLLTPAMIFVCFGLTVWILKADLAAIRKRMDCFESSQHACQLSNAKEFSTWEQHNKLADKVDGIDERLTRVEARGDGNGRIS